MNDRISLQHGDGGLQTNRLIQDIFYKHFDNEVLTGYQDAAIFTIEPGRLAFTTDTFVVDPIFFHGGDIGKLSVCGTVNDLTAAGAIPLYLSAGFVIEEGFEILKLDEISASISYICKKVGARIATGDTKVVEKGSVNGVHINTSGIGMVHPCFSPRKITSGDEIILTGTIAEHGTEILIQRYGLDVQGDFISDCYPLSEIIPTLGEQIKYVKMMRDPTRGGIATSLCEISENQKIGTIINEDSLPIRPCVKAIHDLLGTDPLYFASEGRMILIVEKGHGKEILNKLKNLESCSDSSIIGIFDEAFNKVCLCTTLGGKRILSMLENHMIPRIC